MGAPFSTLILASHNAGKLRELKAMLAPFSLEVESVAQLGLPEPVEDGDSFAENALIKARAAATAAKQWALSDDSGLVVPALDGAPGIYSARWAGPSKDFSIAMARIEKELVEKGLTPTGTPAYFICVIGLVSPSGEEFVFEGKAHGTLVFPARGSQGFGYDPIFVPEGKTLTFAEIPLEEKQAMSHRAHAFEHFTQWLDKEGHAHVG